MGMVRKMLNSLLDWILFNDEIPGESFVKPGEKELREREFIKAANGLKTLRVTARGGMAIDPEEIKEQILAARAEYKCLVK
jgi:hypothetical protein